MSPVSATLTNEAPPARRRGGTSLLRNRGHRIDDAAHFGDLAGREARKLRVLLHRRLTFSEIDAERLVVRDVGLHPLHLAGELGERAVGGRGRILELGRVEAADA